MLRKAGLLCAVALTTCGFGATANAQVPAHPIVRSARPGPPTTGSAVVERVLSQGVNTFNGDTRNKCVDGTYQAPTSLAGSGYRFEVKLIKSEEDFSREVGVAVSGSTSIGIVNLDASARYNNSVSISATSDYLMVRIKVDGARIPFEPEKLTDAAKLRANKRSFFLYCGNSFVSEVELGGDFVAIMEFAANSQTERTDVQANLRAATAASSLNAEFKTSVQNAQKKSSMHATILRRGTGDAVPEVSIDKLIEYAREFPKSLNLNNAVVLGVTLSDYGRVDPEVETVPMPSLVRHLKDRLSVARSVIAQVDPLIAANQRLALPARISDLQRLKQDLPGRIDDLSDALGACAESAWNGCNFTESQRTFPEPHLPGYPIVAPFTSRHGGRQLVGVVSPGEERIMLVRGRFDANSNGMWVEAANNISVIFERPDGTTRTIGYTPPVRFAEPGTVYVRVNDSKYEDNIDSGIEAVLY